VSGVSACCAMRPHGGTCDWGLRACKTADDAEAGVAQRLPAAANG
jgi:hypothetical protein